MSKILVVDDDPISRRSVSELLGLLIQNYEFPTACDGQEAIDVLKSTPDVAAVVTDLDMPTINGFQLTIWIKRNFPEVKVIMRSGNPEEDIADQAREAGVDRFFSKAIKIEEIAGALQSFLEVI